VCQNLQSTLSEIRACELEFGRAPGSVALLAVSKGQSLDKIKNVYGQGQRLFGENYLQEAREKMDALKKRDIEWHFIGRVQSNKTKLIAEHFDWVQSVSSVKVAKRLDEQRPHNLAPLNICLQVNISQEASKDGFLPNKLMSAVAIIAKFKQLALRGIMAIPKAESEYQVQLNVFKKARALFEKLNQQGFNCDTLSMGMTSDFRAAIEAGSTMIRVGTAIFGERG